MIEGASSGNRELGLEDWMWFFLEVAATAESKISIYYYFPLIILCVQRCREVFIIVVSSNNYPPFGVQNFVAY